MIVSLDELSESNKRKYDEFEREVNLLLANYKKTDPVRFELVQRRIEQKGKKWDGNVDLVDGENKRSINTQALLAYEYCLEAERITNKKVSFEATLDKLFKGVDKFRIGNPIPGEDDECLYGRGYDDESAIPVTSKKYRMVMNAGAQHLDYIKDGKYAGAVFIYARKVIPDFIVDEHGNKKPFVSEGINFEDISRGQSLLTNLRQTTFHEWTHNAEKDVLDADNPQIPYEYDSVDERKYRNYDKVSEYVLLAPDGSLKLSKKKLDRVFCISTGLTTKEVLPDGEIRMHNMVTEGFVEMIAREMVMAVDPRVRDIEIGRYADCVEIARRVVEARDTFLGRGKGATVADFITHSSLLKRELEEKVVYQKDGSKIDGLHYISNYASDAQRGRTPKRKLLGTLPDLEEIFSLSEDQVREIKSLDLWKKKSLTEEDKKVLIQKLAGGNEAYFYLTEEIAEAYAKTLDDERDFYDTIGKKLGYDRKRGEIEDEER